MKNRWNIVLGCALLLCGVALGEQTYTIKPGDNLTKIARKHGCTVSALLKENNLKPNTAIHPGQKLKIPGASSSVPAAPAAAPTASTSSDSHTVQPGETFSSISRRYKIPVDDLMAANPGTDPKTLKPGQKIKLVKPRDAGSEAPAPAVAPAEQNPTPEPEKPAVITVAVEAEMTFGEFAAKHGTDVARLNELNGLDLDSATLLAKGSELYVPQQPKAVENNEP